MSSKNKIRRLLNSVIKFGMKFVLIYTGFVLFIILFFKFIHPPTSAFIQSKIEEPLKHLVATDDIKHKPISFDNMSRYVALAVIASEDQQFFLHFGFDFEQIEKAIKENNRRKRIRGASTISMQVAKNLFLWSGKNFIRKGLEAYYTVILELVWTKKRIIETYLNIAEMGKGVYGVQAAANIFFNKNAKKLNMSESAMLATVLPNPKIRNPRRPSSYMLGRRATIMKQMNLIGGVNLIKKEFE